MREELAEAKVEVERRNFASERCEKLLREEISKASKEETSANNKCKRYQEMLQKVANTLLDLENAGCFGKGISTRRILVTSVGKKESHLLLSEPQRHFDEQGSDILNPLFGKGKLHKDALGVLTQFD